MSTAVWTPRLELDCLAEKALEGAVGFWFVVTGIGQGAFFYYLAAFYGATTLHGNIQAWTKNVFPVHSYARGDTGGNLAFGAHVFFVAAFAFSGAIQLLPQIRKRALSVHRWNGRFFALTALGISVSGLYLKFVRERADILNPYNFSLILNALFIIAFLALAWRSAVAHQISTHRRWALRAYVVANGQWFFRAGFFAWLIINRGPVGIGKNFDGPFILIWSFGCYLLPLLVLELYLRAKKSGKSSARFAMAGGLVVLTLLMGAGVVGVAAGMWWPTLARL